MTCAECCHRLTLSPVAGGRGEYQLYGTATLGQMQAMAERLNEGFKQGYLVNSSLQPI
jgi:hypothetical protein